MCEKSVTGVIPVSKRYRENEDGSRGDPIISQGAIPLTNLDNCQRSGVFTNNCDDAVMIVTNGAQYSIPPGMVATFPVGNSIQFMACASGTVSYLVTTAALTAGLSQAPGPRSTGAQVFALEPEQVLTLSSGEYTKLSFQQISTGEIH